MRRWIIIGITFLVLLGFIALRLLNGTLPISDFYEQKSKTDPGQKAGRKFQKNKELPTPSLEITAEELGAIFSVEKTKKVNQQFAGKVLRVEGEMHKFAYPYAYLRTGAVFRTGSPVLVSLRFMDANAGKRIPLGKRFVVDGRFTEEGIFGPILKDCVFPQ